MDGGTLYDFDISDPLDISKLQENAKGLGQIGFHAIGFSGTEMSELKERDWAIKEAMGFYKTRKMILLNDIFIAKDTNDREGMKDAKDAIRNYNKTVPHPSLKITNLTKSLKMKKRNQRQAEKGLGRGKRAVPTARHLQELYPVEEESVR
jgi:hypothetical protein